METNEGLPWMTSSIISNNKSRKELKRVDVTRGGWGRILVEVDWLQFRVGGCFVFVWMLFLLLLVLWLCSNCRCRWFAWFVRWIARRGSFR